MAANKILIVDDHLVTVEGIKSTIREVPGLDIVGEASNGVMALEQIKALRPDIVIMDISMPDMNGIETTHRIKHLAPEVSIIIFTMHSNKQYLLELFNSGISAYVLKSRPLSDLILAISEVRRGGTYFGDLDAILKRIKDDTNAENDIDAFESLSMRERQILTHLADGKSIKAIAYQLCISPKTVETHKYHIMQKLGINSMADLIKTAIKKRLIEL